MTAWEGNYKELHPYQDRGVQFMVDNPASALFVGMGLGKTGIVLNALLEIPGPTLLVGPIRVIETVWRKEAKQWPGPAVRDFRFSLLRGKPMDRRDALLKPADVYMVNPELLPEVLDALAEKKRGAIPNLIIDESTMFKDPSSRRFKTLRKRLRLFERKTIMTGTPAPNSLLDMWAQTFILDQGERLGKSFTKFKSTYFYTTDWLGYEWAEHDWARDEITKKISDLVYEVTYEEAAIDRFEPNIHIVGVDLPAEARAFYRQMEKLAFAEIDEKTVITASTAAVVTLKLRQIAAGFIYDDDREIVEVHREKIKATKRLLREFDSPTIIVYQFTHELEALKRAIPQGVVFDSDKEDDWNRGKIPVLFLHPQSGGHGLNLQFGGHHMIIYSASYSLEQMSQVVKRIDRQGQKVPPEVHYLVARNTIDEVIVEVLQTKEDNQREMLHRLREYILNRRALL